MRAGHWFFYFQENGGLSDLFVAFSRDQAEKVYVQHLLRKAEISARVWKLLESGGHFYICGDAKNMAREVLAALEDILCTQGNMDATAAQEYIKRMQNKGRYSADVWS